MTQVQVSVAVEKSGMDLIQHLAALVKAAKAAGGFSAAALPAEIAALVANLPAIIADAGAAPGELKEDLVGFVKGANLALYDLYDALHG